MKKADEEMLDKKYPEGYFDHYIAMFQSGVCKEGFEEHANIYITIEGIQEFNNMVCEILSIDKNNDWSYFVDLAKDYEKGYLDLKDIKKLAQTAIDISKKCNP